MCSTFRVSSYNNETKYKALITELKITKKVGVRYLTTFSDFQLAIEQVKNEYEAQEKKHEEISWQCKRLDLTISKIRYSAGTLSRKC